MKTTIEHALERIKTRLASEWGRDVTDDEATNCAILFLEDHIASQSLPKPPEPFSVDHYVAPSP